MEQMRWESHGWRLVIYTNSFLQAESLPNSRNSCDDCDDTVSQKKSLPAQLWDRVCHQKWTMAISSQIILKRTRDLMPFEAFLLYGSLNEADSAGGSPFFWFQSLPHL